MIQSNDWIVNCVLSAMTLKNGGNVLIPCYPTVSEKPYFYVCVWVSGHSSLPTAPPTSFSRELSTTCWSVSNRSWTLLASALSQSTSSPLLPAAPSLTPISTPNGKRSSHGQPSPASQMVWWVWLVCHRLCDAKKTKVFLPELPFPHSDVSNWDYPIDMYLSSVFLFLWLIWSKYEVVPYEVLKMTVDVYQDSNSFVPTVTFF